MAGTDWLQRNGMHRRWPTHRYGTSFCSHPMQIPFPYTHHPRTSERNRAKTRCTCTQAHLSYPHSSSRPGESEDVAEGDGRRRGPRDVAWTAGRVEQERDCQSREERKQRRGSNRGSWDGQGDMRGGQCTSAARRSES